MPCVVRWPSRLPGNATCGEPLWSMDFLPMAIRAAGGSLPSDRVLDGRDPTAALAGESPSPHDQLCFHYGASSAVRSARHKLFRRNGRSPWELFDLQTDVGETANLAAREPGMVNRLSSHFRRWYEDARQEKLP